MAAALFMAAQFFSSSAVAADWAKSFFSAAGTNITVNATAIDTVGNTYVAGSFSGDTAVLGSVTLTRFGVNDTFAAKMENESNVLWTKNFGGGFRAGHHVLASFSELKV
jgi:hypothetical protein